MSATPALAGSLSAVLASTEFESLLVALLALGVRELVAWLRRRRS